MPSSFDLGQEPAELPAQLTGGDATISFDGELAGELHRPLVELATEHHTSTDGGFRIRETYLRGTVSPSARGGPPCAVTPWRAAPTVARPFGSARSLGRTE